MDGLDVGAVLHCQRLETLACAGTVFASTIWNGLLAVNGFQNYIYVNTVDEGRAVW